MKDKTIVKTPNINITYKDDPKAREEFIHFMMEYFISKNLNKKAGENQIQ